MISGGGKVAADPLFHSQCVWRSDFYSDLPELEFSSVEIFSYFHPFIRLGPFLSDFFSKSSAKVSKVCEPQRAAAE